VSSAESLHERGVLALNRGRLAPARRLLERAIGLGPDDDLAARIEASLAYVLFETGEAAEALAMFDVALGRGSVSPDTEGTVWSQIGLVRMLRGEGEDALAAFGQAVRLIEDERVRGRVHLNRGNVHLQRNNLPDAARDFAEARRCYRAVGDDLGAAKAGHNLGYVRMCAGDLPGALRTMAEAYDAFAAEGPVMAAIADQDRAEALLQAGLMEEGRTALRRAADAYGRRRLYQRQGEAELTLSRTAVQSDPRLALAAGRRARDRFVRSDAPSWRLRAEAEILAAQVELGRKLPDAGTSGDQLARDLDAHRLRWNAAAVRLHTARALISTGEVEEAAARLSRVRLTRAAPLAVRLTAHDVRAELAHRQGRRSAALRQVRAGLADLHDWQSSFGSLDLQTNVVGHGTRLGVRGLALAMETGRPEVLFEWSERARMLASRVQPVRPPQDERLASDLAQLRAGAAPQREAQLRQRVREQAWQTKGSGEVADPVTLAELQPGLGGDTALAAYVVTADKVVALVVTDGAALRHDLGDRSRLDDLLGGLLPDLDMAASDLPGPLAGSVRQGLADRLARIGDLLVAPLLDDLDDRRVVLTPSGVLAGVPWPLLPGLTGRPVTVARSATSWLARQTTTSTATAGFVAGPRVARADAEVAAAASRWKNAPVLTGDAATASAVTELAGRVDVLHIAAHGRHSAENPLFSGLELADGSWFGYDIDQLPSVPQVVLLSACEVGRSSVRHGEELIGMTTAWLHAGVRWVIASAAAANDEVAHDTLVAVHAGLRAGLDPAAALAAVEHREGAAPAPFVCFS
jgi:tetratricopeptide (TPR) repeat protein